MHQWRKETDGWRDNNKMPDFKPQSKQGKNISRHIQAINKQMQRLIESER